MAGYPKPDKEPETVQDWLDFYPNVVSWVALQRGVNKRNIEQRNYTSACIDNTLEGLTND